MQQERKAKFAPFSSLAKGHSLTKRCQVDASTNVKMLARIFPDGHYPCTFLGQNGQGLVVLGLYPPAGSVVDRQHANITSRVLGASLGHTRFDWVDAIPHAPRGRCQNVNLPLMEKHILASTDVWHNLSSRLETRDPRVVYVAGKCMSALVNKRLDLVPVCAEYGVYRDDVGGRLYVVGRKHPTAHLLSADPNDAHELQTTP